MKAGTFPLAYRLTLLAALLAAVASAGGLLISDLYRDSEAIKKAWFANDLVTLLVVVPALVLSSGAARRGSDRAQLLWAGLLGYLIYNFAFYLFGSVFNRFFLLYVALFAISVYALIMVLSNLDVQSIGSRFSSRMPVRSIGLYLLFISLPLALVEINWCVEFILTGKLPAAPSLIFALDLSVVVPNTALAAFLLWRRHPWGYVLGAIMLVKGITYGLVLCLGTAFIAGFRLSGTWDPLMPFYVFVAAGSTISLFFLLRGLKTAAPAEATPRYA